MDPSPDPSMPIGSQVVFLVLLVLLNAFFSASEMAIVSVNKNKIKILSQEGNVKAKLLLDLIEEPNRFLSTIQVAITLAGFLASAVAAIGMADDLGMYITRLGIPYGTQFAVVIVTLILSYFSLVFGELYPKRMALQHALKISLATVKIVLFLSKVMAPFVILLSWSVTVLLKITRQKTTATEDEFSEDDVMSMVEVGQETGFLKEEGARMISSIFAFDEIGRASCRERV